MHGADVVQHVRVVGCHDDERDQEVEPEQHLGDAPQGEVFADPEEREVAWMGGETKGVRFGL